MDNQPVDTIYIELAAKTDRFKKEVEDSVRDAKIRIQNDLKQSITSVGEEVDKVSAKLKGLTQVGRADIRLQGSSSGGSVSSSVNDSESNRQIVRQLADVVNKITAMGVNRVSGTQEADAGSGEVYNVVEALKKTNDRIDELILRLKESNLTGGRSSSVAGGGGGGNVGAATIEALAKNADAISASIRSTNAAVDELKKAVDIAAAVKAQAQSAGISQAKPRELKLVECPNCATPNDVNINKTGSCIACGAPLKLVDINQGIEQASRQRKFKVQTAIGTRTLTENELAGSSYAPDSVTEASRMAYAKGPGGQQAQYSGDTQQIQQQMASQVANLDRAVGALAAAAGVLQSLSTGVDAMAKLAQIQAAVPALATPTATEVTAKIAPGLSATTKIEPGTTEPTKAGMILESSAKAAAAITVAAAETASKSTVSAGIELEKSTRLTGASKSVIISDSELEKSTRLTGSSKKSEVFSASIQEPTVPDSLLKVAQDKIKGIFQLANSAFDASVGKIKEAGTAINEKVVQPLVVGAKATLVEAVKDPLGSLKKAEAVITQLQELGGKIQGITGALKEEEVAIKENVVFQQSRKSLKGGNVAGYSGDVIEEVSGSAPSAGVAKGTSGAGAAKMARDVNQATKSAEADVISLDKVVSNTLANMGQSFMQTKNPIAALVTGVQALTGGMQAAAASGNVAAGAIANLAGPAALVVTGLVALNSTLGESIRFLQQTSATGMKLAADVDTLQAGLGVLAKNSGISITAVREKVSELQATGITTKSSIESLMKFMGQKMPVDNIEKLARAGQNLAIAFGRDSTQAFDTINYAISTGNAEVLRGIGITKTANTMYEEYAITVGKTGNKLTELERKQAIVNGVMKAAAPYAGLYEKSMESLGKKMGSLARYVEEGTLALGSTLMPVLDASVTKMTNFWKAFQALFVQLKDLKLEDGSIRKVPIMAADGSVKLTELGQSIYKMASTVKDITVPAFDALFLVMKLIGTTAGPMLAGIGPILKTVADNTKGVVTQFSDWVKLVQSGKLVLDERVLAVAKIAAFATSLGIVLAILGALPAAITAVTGAIVVLSGALTTSITLVAATAGGVAAVTMPLWLAVAAVAAVSFAILGLGATIAKALDPSTKLTNWVDVANTGFTALSQILAIVAAGLAYAFSFILDGLKNVARMMRMEMPLALSEMDAHAQKAAENMVLSFENIKGAAKSTAQELNDMYKAYVDAQKKAGMPAKSKEEWMKPYEDMYIAEQKAKGVTVTKEQLYGAPEAPKAALTETQLHEAYKVETGLSATKSENAEALIKQLETSLKGIDPAWLKRGGFGTEPYKQTLQQIEDAKQVVEASKDSELKRQGYRDTTTDYDKWLAANKGVGQSTAGGAAPTAGFLGFAKAKIAEGSLVPPETDTAANDAKISAMKKAWSEQLIQAQEDADKSLLDLDEQYSERRIQINENLVKTLENINKNYVKSQEQAKKNHLKAEAQLEKDLGERAAEEVKSNLEKIAEERKNLDEQQAKAKRDFLAQMKRMEDDYYSSLGDAVQQRDATAVLRLMRQHDIQTSRANVDFNTRVADEEEGYKKWLAKIPTSEAAVRTELKKEYDKRRKQLDESYQEQLADMAENYREQKSAAYENYAEELKTLVKEKEKQSLKLIEANKKRIDDLTSHWSDVKDLDAKSAAEAGAAALKAAGVYYGENGKYDALMVGFYARQKRNAGVEDAQKATPTNPSMPGAVPGMIVDGKVIPNTAKPTTPAAQPVSPGIGGSPAAPAGTAAPPIGTITLTSGGVRFRSSPSDADLGNVISSYGSGTTFTALGWKQGWFKVSHAGTTGYLKDAAWTNLTGASRGGMPSFAKGGMAIADSATTVQFGDAGKEAAIFLPLDSKKSPEFLASLMQQGVGSAANTPHQVLDVNIKIDANNNIGPEMEDKLLSTVADVIRKSLPKSSKVTTSR